MDFRWTPEQEELRDTARAFLAEHSGSEQVRAAMASELGYDPAVWKALGAELGWTAVTIPEAHGGLGLTAVELAALLEPMGESLLCAPFFSSVCLGAGALLAGGDGAAARTWLPAIAEGRTRATLAWMEPGGGFDAADIETRASRQGDGWVLRGRKAFVVDGHCADLLVIAARADGSAEDEGLGLFAVPAESPGVTRRLRPTLDQTRRLADVELDGVTLSGDARVGGEGEGAALLRDALDAAVAALAVEQVGGAQRCLDLAVAYAGERVQFGRPIGSFQAIKHRCADMMTDLEAARSGAYHAACAQAEGSPQRGVAASLAAVAASEAYFRCAADGLQIHGGVGFTWEYDVHLYLKRARASEGLLGDPGWHRERLAREIGL